MWLWISEWLHRTISPVTSLPAFHILHEQKKTKKWTSVVCEPLYIVLFIPYRITLMKIASWAFNLKPTDKKEPTIQRLLCRMGSGEVWQADVTADSNLRSILVYYLSLKFTDVILVLSTDLKKTVNINQLLKKIVKCINKIRILRPNFRLWCCYLVKFNFVRPPAGLPTSHHVLDLTFYCNIIALKLLGSKIQTCSVLHLCLQISLGLSSTSWIGMLSHISSCFPHPDFAESLSSYLGHCKPVIVLIFDMVQRAQSHGC